MPSGKNPFADLEKLRASLPAGPAPAPAPAGTAPAGKAGPKPPARAVVRMERKGRGGKEVTIISMALQPAERERWCRELKQALGCGGSVDGELIVLQGDLRSRIGAVLEARGIGRVTIG